MSKTNHLFVFFICFSFSQLFSQSTTVKFDNVTNEYKIQKNSESSNGISVLITDSKNASHPKQFNFSNTDSESTFVNKVISNMKDVSEKYFFVVDDNRVISIVKDDDLEYESIKINKPESQEDLSSFLKEAFVLEYENLITTLEKDNPKPIFKGIKDNFKLVKKDDNNFDLVYINKIDESVKEPIEEPKAGQGINDVVCKKLFEKFDDVMKGLKPLLISKERFNEIKALKLNETNRFKLSELYNALKEDKTYKFINNVILKTTDKEDTGIVYNISIKNNNKDKYYNLKFCDPTNKCSESIKMLYSSDYELFEKIVNGYVGKIDSKGYQNLNKITLKNLYGLINKNNEKSIIKEATDPLKKTIDSLVLGIENLETQFSGKLKLNKTVRVYRKRKVVNDTTFKVDYATVRFFNNKAKDIVLVGKLSSIDREFTVVNVQFSVSLRSFRNNLNYVPIATNPNEEYLKNLYLNYNDLFEYYPKETSSNYAVRNKNYRIEADSIVPIEERKLMDYFTAVIFSDFLGLNGQNANSLMQAEGRVKIPIWILNRKWFSVFHSLNADINASIYNGFDDNSRFITPVSQVLDTIGGKVLESATINNFDYIKYNNLTAGINLDVLNIEMKGLSTDWSFGYGLRYYRAGLKYTEPNAGLDVVKKYQLNAITHEISTNFEIRPQLNFGADLNLALNWLHGRGSVENLDVSYNPIDGNDKKKVLRVQLNLYSKLNPSESNGGIYARIGGFYHLGAKDFYPQILVGYATNLSSFVNKFSKK